MPAGDINSVSEQRSRAQVWFSTGIATHSAHHLACWLVRMFPVCNEVRCPAQSFSSSMRLQHAGTTCAITTVSRRHVQSLHYKHAATGL